MEQILNEIQMALSARLYFVALAMTLTLPDICSGLESPDGETSGPRYKAWYTTNLSAQFPWLTDVDCYSLRCGVVHQGRFGNPRMQYGRVIFTLPDGRGNTFTNCILNDAYTTDAVGFCRAMVDAVRRWFAAAQTNPIVQGNLPRLVQIRPQGMAPYIVGAPIIA